MKIDNDDRKTKRKILRLLCFVLSGLLVMTVSAAVYYSLSMQPTVSITTPVVAFAQGDDWSKVAGSLGPNGTWCNLALKAYPNATMTYEEPLNLTNTGTQVSIKLRAISISPASGNPSVSNFTFINFTLHDDDGLFIGYLNYSTGGANNWIIDSDIFPVNMDAGDEYYISIQTKAAAGAQGSIVANIEITVDVQE